MITYKMSDNDAWVAEDNNFSADVIVKTDDANNYKECSVKLTKLNADEIDATIKLNIINSNFVASLEKVKPLGKNAMIEEVANYAKSLNDYSNFMDLLGEESNSQLKAVDGLFKQNRIKL